MDDKMKNDINDLFKEISDLSEYLASQHQISFKIRVDDHFTKGLVLYVASYFESKICEIILSFFHETSKSTLIYEFTNRKGIERQYHTFFDWKTNNANNFFRLFGDEFSSFMKNKVKNDDKLNKGIEDFLSIGSQRNLLMHKNLLTSNISNTKEDILVKFENACYFIDEFKKCLIEFHNASQTSRT